MKRITVRNFGPIRDVSIELKDYNFFIGSQGVGKSTLAKLISILTDFRIYWDMSVEGDMPVFIPKLAVYNIKEYLSKDSYIAFEFTSDRVGELGNINLTFNYENETIDWDVKSPMTEDSFNKLAKASALLPFISKKAHQNFIEESLNLLKIKEQDGWSPNTLSEYASKVGNSFQNVLYVPAERILFSMLPKMQSALSMVDQSIPKMFLFYSILLNDAKAFFKTYHVDMLGLDYQKKAGEDIVRLDNGKEMPLNTTSSGMQSLIPLLLTLDYSIREKGFHSYVIEEPECNLFPDNQCLLIDSMIEMLNSADIPDTTSTITTHSPYVINYLNVLMRRAEKNSDKPSISADNLSVYMINDDGTAENLMSIDNHTDKFVVNTFDLTEKMTEMYAEYKELS